MLFFPTPPFDMAPSIMRHLSLLAATSLVASLAAQGTVVPASRVTQTGGGYTSFPHAFKVTGRLQQITTELSGKPLPIAMMSYRRHYRYKSSTGGKARTCELELFCGQGTFTAFTSNFASNWSGASTQVIKKRKVQLPDWTQDPAGAPAPFTLSYKFDRPYVYDGKKDFLYEIRVHTVTDDKPYPHDHARQGGTQFHYGKYSGYGKGCVSTGAAGAFYQQMYFKVNSASKGDLYYNMYNGPANAAAVLMIGSTAIDLKVPGLCTNLFVQPIVTIPVGVLSATGSKTTTHIPGLAYNLTMALAKIHGQAVAIDKGQKVIPVSAARRSTVELPKGHPDVKVTLKRMYNSSDMTAPTGYTPQNGGAIFKIN